jgi:diguanylate cyclase (GGDEF)-like protein/PAS domain S-box-containing protein
MGIAGLQPAVIGHIRAEQIRAIVRLTPVMMLGTLGSALAVLAMAWGRDIRLVVLGLCLGLAAVAGLELRGWWHGRSAPPRHAASPRAIGAATRHALLLGLLWGGVTALTYPGAAPAEQMVMAAVIAVIGTAGGFALAPMPQAAAGFLLPLVVGAAMALALAGGRAEAFLAVLGGLNIAVIGVACIAHARIFVAHLRARIEAVEQRSVVSMLLKSFEENAQDCLWQLDARGRFTHVSERMAAMLGLDRGALDGKGAADILRRLNFCPVKTGALRKAFRARRPFRDIEAAMGDARSPHWWRLTGEPLHDDLGRFMGFRGVCSDVTAAKQAEQRMAYLAHHDSLTGTYNRVRFGALLAGKCLSARQHGEAFALAYLDLDGFKGVNDTFGHPVGDQLLIDVVKRLQGLLPAEAVLARLGGDEFAVLTGDVDRAALETLATRLIETLSQPYPLAGHTIHVGASVGLVAAEDMPESPEAALRKADLALYHAREAGQGTFAFYSAGMDSQLHETLMLEADLALAIPRGQLEVHFQPFVQADTGRIAGFEALVRWHHPERGLVPPMMFIPIAEKSLLIRQIGLWVLNEACRAASLWPKNLTVAVNLSARQFSGPNFTSDIRAALTTSGLAPEQLELEITESVLIEQPEAVIETLKELKSLGIHISLDDFGTGYSSLSYLWRFPFDKIKIDGSFVSAISRDESARHILTTIRSLADTMGLSVTAERVETAEELDFLRRIRCDYVQGYYFSKPLPEAELSASLMRALEADLAGATQKSSRRRNPPAPRNKACVA